LKTSKEEEVIRPDEGPVSKTGVRQQRIVGSSPTASAANRITRERGDHREPPIPETRSEQRNPMVQRQRLLAYTQATMVRVHPGLLPILLARLRRAASMSWRVLRLLPEAQPGNAGPRRGARPSPPPCHGGDRGFKSHRGRFGRVRGARYANRQSGEAQTFVSLWVRLPLVPLPHRKNSRRLGIGVPKWL
jgi:hypothetical protein